MMKQTFNRRDSLKVLGAGGLSLALPGCAAQLVDAATAPAPTTVSASLDAMAWRLLELSPESATSAGIDTGEHAYLRSRLSDRSQAGQEQVATLLRNDLARAKAIDTAALDPATRTSVEVVKAAYQTALDGFALLYGDITVGGWRNAPYVVIQNVGGYLDYPRFMDSSHPVREKADAEAYLARLEAIPAQLAGELERIKSARALGLVPPDFLLTKAVAQLKSSLLDAMEGGALVSSLTSRTGDIPGDWEARAKAIVSQQIAPALEAQLAELFAQQKVATGAPGMDARPHGEDFYAWSLRAATTTSLDPAEVNRRGLEELDALHARMEPILQSLGYTKGSVGERMSALGDDPRFKFAEGDPGRAQIMAFIQERIDWIKAQMPRAFLRTAPGNVEVKRLPLSEEPGAPTAYGGAGSIDGTIPGRMWINLRTTELHRKYDLPTLVHHETIPGHVWEGEYANQMPLIRSLLSFSAYTEGWALYGEQLADELGAYDDDPVGRLGYLQSLSFRACRMVVDTGLHARGWSREQAIRFFMERNGNKREEVENEVDRYCSWPGQACGYKMGHSEIVRQRARAKAALADGFDMRAFNQAVIEGGNVPLDVLGGNVDRFIAAA
ncbi:MAG: DUF885 domain-containing protein [Sphingomonadaceae bacterium]